MSVSGGRLRGLVLLGVAVFTLSFAVGVQTTTLMNFLVEEIGIGVSQLGVLESIREVPGFLSSSLVGLGSPLPEPFLAGISLLLFSAGIGCYYVVHSIPSLVLSSFVWSLGLHCWMPLRSSMVLGLSERGSRGRRLGQMDSVASLASLAAMGIVLVIASWALFNYRRVFLVASAVVAVGAVVVLFVRKDVGEARRPRMVFRREYRLYYALSLLEGCRKQMFITFAVFALVRVYGTGLGRVALLMLINSALGLVFAPGIGRLNDRVGERRTLTISYAGLVAVFLGYGLVHRAEVLYGLYCLDSLLYIFSTIALTTLIHRMAPREHVTPSLAMGVTMNHVAAVTVPLMGSLIWSALGYETTFLAGAVVVLASLLLTQKVR